MRRFQVPKQGHACERAGSGFHDELSKTSTHSPEILGTGVSGLWGRALAIGRNFAPYSFACSACFAEPSREAIAGDYCWRRFRSGRHIICCDARPAWTTLPEKAHIARVLSRTATPRPMEQTASPRLIPSSD